MTDIQVIAAILLTLRLVGDVFMLAVLRRQWHLFRYHIDESLRSFRKLLFAITIILLLGNCVPIVIDAIALLGMKLGDWLILYAVTNAVTAFLAALFIWILYRMATMSNKEDAANK